MLFRRAILLSICLSLPAGVLCAQTADSTRLVPVVSGSDGTEVLIDASSVTRSGDSAFVVSTVTRFPRPVGTRTPADRQVDTDELDCAGGRTRGITWALYNGARLVSADTAAHEWKTVDADTRPISEMMCAVLLRTFAALPVEPEAEAREVLATLSNGDSVNAVLRRNYPTRIRGTRGYAGRTVLRLRITPEGQVDADNIRVLWSARPEFGEAARLSMAVARVTPVTRDGAAVPAWIILPIEFGASCGNHPGPGGDEERATLTRSRTHLSCAW